MNKKLLVICGPTATGKTFLGGLLAKKFNGEIVSADSRQVYKGMDIGTGKEWIEGVKIHGHDLVSAKDEYSVSDYYKFAVKTIKDIQERKKLPILVGGTGFYIKAVVDGIPTISVPKNEKLRKNLEGKNTKELYDKLATLDAAKAASMNLSDSKNPRRLVRAIEVAQYNLVHGTKTNTKSRQKRSFDLLSIGLNLNKEGLRRRIEKRVEDRLNLGFVFEIETLLKNGVFWKNQSMKSLGYKEAEDFLKKGLSYEEFVDIWVKAEFNYAKRQLTWFKKDKKINWFDVQGADYPENVEKLVKKWYSSS